MMKAIRHVSAVLKYAEHKEEDKHLRNEAENRADTGNDTVNDKPYKPFSCAHTSRKPLNGSTIHSPTNTSFVQSVKIVPIVVTEI